MIYKTICGEKISWLGMGAMRLPIADGKVDEPKAIELVEHAIAQGINYFDTAYFYHGGNSERVLGKALARFPRDTWYLCDKMPGNLMTYADGKLTINGFNLEGAVYNHPREVFELQLERCGVEYFDFYMLHNLAETTFDFYTNPELDMVGYLLEEKRAGRIKHLGFSAHGRAETIEAFLQHLEATGRGGTMEFCMIQINYLDWKLQEADKKYDVLTKYGIPVLSMEPVRGGRLCNLGDGAAPFTAARPDWSQAAWAFRYLQSLENLPIIISGMSNMEQLNENLALFKEHIPLTAADHAVIEQVVGGITELAPCTSCRYCIDACPLGLDIPLLLTMYNEAGFEVGWTVRAALRALGEDKQPSVCSKCGKCNPPCPQNINIPQALMRFSELLA